ncbi:MAG: sulfatase [Bacteroidales bacterium]|nr:sulfatase [Bacteroidales bacterium]
MIASGLLAPTVAMAGNKPNIIFFLVDDYGWADSEVAYDGVTYPNNLRFHTPNMVRLAEKGVTISHAYACPVSTPTRTSIMTGMSPVHSHITNWTSMAKDEPSDAVGGANGAAVYGEKDDDVFRRPDWNFNGISPVDGINDTQYATPMVQLLRDNGYYTIHVGKAHWASSGTPGSTPYNMGFLVNVSGTNAGLPKSYLGTENFGNTQEKWNMSAVQDMTQYYGQEIFLTEALTREALRTLEYPVEKGEPFYLYMAHYATHTPIQKDSRFFGRYKDMGQDNGQSKYASMVEGVDKSLGDILDFLDEKGIADNTIIIFMADNGGNADVKSKGGILHTQNAPLREGKGSVYQGGIRVPMSVYWPGKAKAGSRLDIPTVPEDLFPTILDMAGIKKYETVQEVDGESLVPYITGKAKPEAVQKMMERPVVFHYPHQWKVVYKPEVDFLSTIIVGDWKLVYVMMNAVEGQSVDPGRGLVESTAAMSDIPGVRSGALELYNLKEDIGELHNVAGKYPEKVKELAKELSDILRQWDASMPVVRKTALPVTLPDGLL